jgi:hypothetical protein
MAELVFLTAVGQIAMPAAFLVWLWRGSCSGWWEWALKTFVVFIYLALISVAGVWLLVPWYLPYAYAALGMGAAVASRQRMSRDASDRHGRLQARLRRGSLVLMATFCTGVLAFALAGSFPPRTPMVRLSSPLKNGTYYIVNGGYSILINPHMKTLGREQLVSYRGQSYALDIVRLDGFGRRAEGLWPEESKRYHIFGEPVHAPCAGFVVRAESALADSAPFNPDRQHLAGNFVLLECGDDTEVLLAHLMQGSLTVNPGERVAEGQVVGRVGNSGYSTEPHLHLHAQRRSPSGEFLAAEPLPLQIEGRALIRNSRFVSN